MKDKESEEKGNRKNSERAKLTPWISSDEEEESERSERRRETLPSTKETEADKDFWPLFSLLYFSFKSSNASSLIQ
jgi:hypothetical protein